MKKLLIFLTLCLSTQLTTAQTECPTFEWTVNAGNGNVRSLAVVADSIGNTYITGYFTGTATFGNTSFNAGHEEIFIAKINPQGVFEWAVNAGGNGSDLGCSISIDNQGNVYVTGLFWGVGTFGNTTLSSSGNGDVFITKLSPQGQFLWAVRAGGIYSDRGKSISVDNQGNVYVTGESAGTSTFGNITLNSNTFIAKLNSEGIFLWAINGVGYSVNSISVDNQGNTYITGNIMGGATFGSTTLISSGGGDVFIAKLNPQGQFLWAVNAGGASYDIGNSIFVDNQGNVYVMGYFQGTATFGNTILTSSGNDDIFIAKINPQGTFLWTIKAEGGDYSFSNNYGQSISVDNQGNTYVTGYFIGTATFGSTTLTSSGNNDIFITKLNPQGTFLWTLNAGGTNDDQGHSISVDNQGNVYATGLYYSIAYFGDIQLQNSRSFVAKINSGELTISPMNPISISCGESIQLPASTSSAGVQWSPSTGLSNPNILNPIASPTTTTNYTLTAFNSCGGSVSENLTVNVVPSFSVNSSAENSTISCGSSTTLNAMVTGNIPNLTYSWSPATGLSNPNISNPEASPNVTTTYIVTATSSNGCSATSNVTVFVAPTFIVNTSAINTTINCGTSTTLNATVSGNVPNLSYSWSPTTGLSNPTIANPTASPGLTTTYTVTATTPDGCSATSDVTINVNNPNPPVVNIMSNTGVFKLCNGSLTLSAPGFVSYEWSNGSTSPSINVTQLGTYSLIAYEASGCAGTASVTVTALAEILTPQGTVLCPNQAGQSVQLNASGGMDSYQWSTDAQTQGIQVSSAGNYSVTVTKGSCSYTTSVSVTVSNGQAFADFSQSASGLTVDFTTISPSINFLSWDFGDGTTSFVENPTHTYSQAGTYTVTLTVTDVCGNTVEKTKSISVAVVGIDENTVDNSMILYPNPTNDQFTIKSNTPLKQVILRDLNGKVLFTTETIQSEITLDVSHLSNGIYLVEAVNESGRCVQKIVKRD